MEVNDKRMVLITCEPSKNTCMPTVVGPIVGIAVGM